MKKLVLAVSLAVCLVSNSQVSDIKFTMTDEQRAHIFDLINKGGTQEYAIIDGKKYPISFDRCFAIIDSLKKIPKDTLRVRFIKCLNLYRNSLGLSQVTEYIPANDACKFIIDYNKSTNLSHNTNIPGYITFSDRVSKIIKIKSKNAGENLFSTNILLTYAFYIEIFNITLEQFILDQWIHSPGHNKNLTIKNANLVGFAISDRLHTASSIVIEK
jgi:hypothetical protein